MLKVIAPLNKKQPVCPNVQDSDSDPENISVARTSTPVKINTATISKTTPVNSRNSYLFRICLFHCPTQHLLEAKHFASTEDSQGFRHYASFSK